MVIRPGLSILAMLAATASPAATLVVTSAADTASATCASTCTLRQAITAANATAAADTINFAITVPIRGEILISPASPLPTITQPLTINGYSQSGTRVNDDPNVSNAVLRIRLDGANAGSARGLAVCASGVAIRGLSITRFAQRGIAAGNDVAGGNCAAGNTLIEGNFIGLTSGGTLRLGNASGGILLRATATIGGSNPAQRNVIAEPGTGIVLGAGSAGSLVDGNLLGSDKQGNADLGGATGIFLIDDDNSAIGTVLPNTIRHSDRGISVSTDVRGVDLANNRISASGTLGIDLNNNGLTANDANDLDSGANDLQNFPLVTAAQRVPAGVALSGTLDVGHPGSLAYKLTTYASSACHPSGHGEGERILGQTSRNFSSTVETFSYTQITTDPLPPGTQITMTATRAGVGTSEFSACFALDPTPLVVNTTSDTADGVCNAAHCSLRDAIIASNAATGNGFQRIHFAIPPLAGTSEIAIAPTSQLPDITRTVTIDGYTQPGTATNSDPSISNAVIRIRIDGPGVASGLRAFRPCAAGVVIRGLSITRFGTAIEMCSTFLSSIAGNFIGLAADGVTEAFNNIGVLVNAGPVRFGGDTLADRNVLAANIGLALGPGSNGSEVDNNLFGSDLTGTAPRAGSTGIFANAGAASIDIGEQAPNAFRFYSKAISLAGNSGTALRFGRNTFSSHAALGIDLGDDGVTTNDQGDVDAGPNNLQNFPVLTLAERTDTGLRIVGNLDVPPGVTTVAVYASASCHGSGHGPGEQLLGLFATASLVFDQGLITDVDLVAFPQLTATATGAQGTSEMSACLAASDPPPGIAVDTASDNTTLNGGCDVTGDGNTCTLREAITLANAQAGSDAIRFAIPGDGPHVIAPVSPLPNITQGLSIDGYTQVGAVPNADPTASDAVIKIEIRGGSQPATLVTCTSGLVELRGLALNGGTVATVLRGAASNCPGPLRIRGSWLGFGADGASISGAVGVVARDPLTFGGQTLADRNVVGNYSKGLVIRDLATGSVVSANLFGRAPDQSQSADNTTSIELIDVSQVTVGDEGVARNRFFSGTTAILVAGANADFNRLYANQFIATTASTAIDLSTSTAPDGITANDVNDVDSGANEGQNTPILTDGAAGIGTITINGTLDVPAGIAAPVGYRLAFYRSVGCNDLSGSGNGRRGDLYLGSVEQAFASNAENFTVTINIAPSTGFITATATTPGGSTSELSNCLVAPRPDDVFADGFE